MYMMYQSLWQHASCYTTCEVHGEAFDEDWMEGIESGSDVSESDFGSSQSEWRKQTPSFNILLSM